MRLSEIMTEPVVSIDANATAKAAWAKMQQEQIRHLIVTENNQLVGVISDRDLGGKNGTDIRRGRTVRDLMSENIATATPDMTLRQAANLMRGRLIGCLPVLEGEEIVGIVTATDVLDTLGRGATRPEGLYRRAPVVRPPAQMKSVARRPVTRQGVRKKRGRTRNRTPSSDDRAPFAEQIPRAVKAESGRTNAPLVPAHIFERLPKTERLEEADREYIRRKLGMRLGKFARSIERVSVRLKDINGPKGGVDQNCQIKVVLSGHPSLFVEEQDESLKAAFDLALSRIERAVKRQLERSRSKARV